MTTTAEHWALWERDPRATPFQSPAWLDAWWTHLGGGERLDIAVRDAGGKLVAALPMFIWHDEGRRKLVPVGAGHSDYCDALIDSTASSPEALSAALWSEIAETSDRWDELLLPDLRPGSLLLGTVPDGLVASDDPGDVCPVLTLPAGNSPAALLPALSKTQRRKVVHDRHRADNLGGVTVALAAPHEIDAALYGLFELHSVRWQAAGEAGVLADAKVRSFHRAAAPALAAAGLLRLAVVRHHERIVAVLHGFADRHRWHSYINGVDHSIAGQSFGTLAFACMIEAAVAVGASEFHFLRGEEPYKYAWGAVPVHTVRRIIRKR